jgi:hypothetical protein
MGGTQDCDLFCGKEFDEIRICNFKLGKDVSFFRIHF